ncbi:hypothetical protein ACF0H5_023836 [Mactra antiquata]
MKIFKPPSAEIYYKDNLTTLQKKTIHHRRLCHRAFCVINSYRNNRNIYSEVDLCFHLERLRNILRNRDYSTKIRQYAATLALKCQKELFRAILRNSERQVRGNFRRH